MKESNIIHEINMDNIKNEEALVGLLNYMDGDIAIADDIRELPYNDNSTIQLNMLIIIMCIKGKLQLDVNSNTYVVHSNDLLFCRPNILCNNYMLSPDFEGKIVGFSEHILQHFFFNSRNIWNKALYICKNPIIHLNEEKQSSFEHYYELIKLKVNQPPHIYHKEIMRSLLQAALYELLVDLDKLISSDEDNLMRQGDILFKNFMKLLEQTKGKERSVAYYAKELCVTPKYLSYACKVASQKTALKWIHDYTTENIRYMLKHSEKSIKEISDELNFPNISFFGKYVRAHFGMSPREVRKTF